MKFTSAILRTYYLCADSLFRIHPKQQGGLFRNMIMDTGARCCLFTPNQNGSVDLFGTGRERKIQNENICLQRDSNPHPASPRQEIQRLRPLGHEGLMVISGLMSNMIMGYKLKKIT